MAVSQSVISEIIFKFQLLKTQVDEMAEDLAKLKTKFTLFSDTMDTVIGDFKKFDLEMIEEKVFGAI